LGHLHQALLEAYDVGAELVNTVFDAVQSLERDVQVFDF